jgi:hypothetical protein
MQKTLNNAASPSAISVITVSRGVPGGVPKNTIRDPSTRFLRSVRRFHENTGGAIVALLFIIKRVI